MKFWENEWKKRGLKSVIRPEIKNIKLSFVYFLSFLIKTKEEQIKQCMYAYGPQFLFLFFCTVQSLTKNKCAGKEKYSNLINIGP